MPFKWDSETERNLLLFAIGEMSGPPAAIWPAVAEKLGSGLNASACSQKFYKLKRESEKLLGDNDTSTPKTSKGSARKASGSESTATKRKKPQSHDEEDTPTKKIKKTAAPKFAVKEEEAPEEKVQVSDDEDELAAM
ncbi:hypothetical protein A1O3_00062 [Capronia epimyces CBS 606.96]|uniref:Myb-like domain-containing protein n=1 Tax=Capronia epimyces CBS 606.96 TaxID=1182542 RepID=W9ZAH1_9EURO|nr:uncharacterized protein A1O3_00062 [Capronia epimyces CBS 606.96]EXJ91514.1 hypothetical protein A1O3_00062 [Capronia epimyces CBS 606.96]